MKVVFKLPCPESIDATKNLPYIAWRPSASKPVLAVAWGSLVQFIQVNITNASPGTALSTSNLQFQQVGTAYKSKTKIFGMQWIGTQTLGLINERDQLIAFDPSSSKELEHMDIRAMEIVYHTRFSSNNTNTQEKTDLCSYHNSLCFFKEKIYLLGMQRMYCASVMSWSDRIDLLQREGRWTTAIQLCIEFYKGKGNSVVGLPQSKAKQLTRNKVEEILKEKLHFILKDVKEKNIPSEKSNEIITELANLCIESLIEVEKVEFLYDIIYPIFESYNYSNLFFELLEPFILKDKLTFLGPSIMQKLVSYYRSKNKLKQVEQCIVHLDISSLDFHQVVTLCRKENLTSALIYMYNTGLNDYLTPFNDLVKMIETSQENQQQKDEIKSNLLSYLETCLKGKKYPIGNLKIDDIPWVKAEALGFIFDTDQNKEISSWPRVCFFVKLNAKEFFKILTNAFDDPLFSLENLNDLLNDKDKPSWVQFQCVTIDHQVLLDCLYQCVIDQSNPKSFSNPICSTNWIFTIEEQKYLLFFMAKYFSKGTIQLNDDQLNRVLGFLTLTTEKSSLKKREKYLYSILRTCPTTRYSTEKILLLAEGAKMVKVLELFYLRQKNYRKALNAYIQYHKDNQSAAAHNDNDENDDIVIAPQVFLFIQKLMSNPYIPLDEKEEIKNVTLDNLTNLVSIDSEKTSSLIIEYFTQEHSNVWQKLRKIPKLQYEYLKTILSSNQSMDELINRKGITISSEMHECYIKLMCQFNPKAVYPYLLEHTNYRLDYCLSVCQHYDILDASTYLLERTGDVAGALSMILQRSEQSIASLCSLYNDDSQLQVLENEEKKLNPIVDVAIILCKRNSTSLPENESQNLWFRLLDTLVNPMRMIKTKRNRKRAYIRHIDSEDQLPPGIQFVTRVFTDCLTKILQSMMGFIPIRIIMQKIVRDHSTAPFSDFKQIIIAMLDTYNYERNILETAKRLFDADHFREHKTYRKTIQKGFRSSRKSKCTLCERPFLGNIQLTIFSCEHSFHSICVPPDVLSCPACDNRLHELPVPDVDEIPASLSTEDRYQIYLQRANQFSNNTRVIIAKYHNFSFFF